MGRFKDLLWGGAVRQNVFIGLERVLVWDMSPGARLLEVSILQTLTGTGIHLGLLGRLMTPVTMPCKTND